MPVKRHNRGTPMIRRLPLLTIAGAALVIATAAPRSCAHAQQPAPQTPSQVALQMQQIISGWAQGIEALQKQNAELQAQLATLTKDRDEWKAKAEAAAKPEGK